VSILSRDEIKTLMEEVRANHAKLVACKRHEFFSGADTGGRALCMHCGGTVDPIARHWYETGFKHGSGG
jgi:hypothetical protein